MSTVTIPSGGDSEPVVVIKVNGADVSQRVDVPFEADAALLAVLDQSHLADDYQISEEPEPTPVEWVADGLGGTVSDLGGGSYQIDTTVQWQGCICGPITGDFTCTITPEVGATYGLEVGVVATGGGFSDPSWEPYDGRAGAAWSVYTPTGATEDCITDNALGTLASRLTGVDPNTHEYIIERVGSTINLKKDGTTLGSRTLAGSVHLYSSQRVASGRVSTATVETLI